MDAVKVTEWDLSVLRPPAWPADGPVRTWAGLLHDLARIRTYQDDWDGEGTEALRPDLMDSAVALAQALEAAGWAPADIVAGTRDATVCFEWRTAGGFLELEVESPREAEARRVPEGATRAEIVRLGAMGVIGSEASR